jgi:hypothetical protein
MSAAELASSNEDIDFEGESAGFAAGSPVSRGWFQIDDSRFEESTGFLGKASTVRWIEDVGEKVLGEPEQDTLEQTSILISPASFQYLFVDIKSPQGG